MSILINNNPCSINKVAGEWIFKFDTIKHPDFDLLVGYIAPKLNEMYGAGWNAGLTTFETVVKLRNFVRRWGHKGRFCPPPEYTGLDYTEERFTIPEIIKWHEDGNEGYCSWYATMFMYCCEVFGIVARRCGWADMNGGGDQIADVYIPEIRKWVWQSPLFNRWYSLNGEPLSTFDLHELYHQGRLAETTPEHDGYQDESAHLPEAETGYTDFNMWILSHAYAVQMFNRDGDLFAHAKNGVAGITYCYAPDRPLPNGFTKSVMPDRKYFDYDVNTIQISENINVTHTAVITVIDKYVVNFAHYKYERYDGGRIKLSEGTSVRDIMKIEPCYRIVLYPVNTRGGVGNKIEIVLGDDFENSKN